jgi:hypothetical protein
VHFLHIQRPLKRVCNGSRLRQVVARCPLVEEPLLIMDTDRVHVATSDS